LEYLVTSKSYLRDEISIYFFLPNTEHFLQKTLKRIKESFIAAALRDNSIAFIEVILSIDYFFTCFPRKFEISKILLILYWSSINGTLLTLSAVTHYWERSFSN